MTQEISIDLPDNLLLKFEAFAEAGGRSVNDLIVSAVEIYVQQENAETNPSTETPS